MEKIFKIHLYKTGGVISFLSLHFFVRLAEHVSNGRKPLIRLSNGKDTAKTKTVLFIAAVMIDLKYTEISQMKRFCTLLTLKNRSINIYATCVKSHITDDQISHIINQIPDFVHLRILSAFQTETRRK